MHKNIESYLWNEISEMRETFIIKRTPYDVINEILERGWIKSPKQACRTLEKWASKGLYDYGSRLDLGWKVIKEDNGNV